MPLTNVASTVTVSVDRIHDGAFATICRCGIADGRRYGASATPDRNSATDESSAEASPETDAAARRSRSSGVSVSASAFRSGTVAEASHASANMVARRSSDRSSCLPCGSTRAAECIVPETGSGRILNLRCAATGPVLNDDRWCKAVYGPVTSTGMPSVAFASTNRARLPFVP